MQYHTLVPKSARLKRLFTYLAVEISTIPGIL